MMPVVQALLLALALGFSTANRNPKCDAKQISRRLGYDPDAWTLINREHPKYHLMFYSSGNLSATYKCLCTTTSWDKSGSRWRKVVKFHYSPNETIFHGTDTVLTVKTDQYYVYDNAFNATYFVPALKEIEFKEMFSVSELIFAYERKCVIMRSDLLGYQVWVGTHYLKKYRKIPYVCTFMYEACAGTSKYWLYDWDHCLDTTHQVRENQEPLLANI
ncbi:uncharacterized protein LOC119385215 [Rhipicephalus sanguineus]|uniref:uncharacterized protein LOC119385215 n=1 Tax=Rhipicephalus sanguineus TaxID=34632 RepID=UPI001892E85F|nr:uncharacterized protein LOC119385215 [Rhipicephalus sanguineus]